MTSTVVGRTFRGRVADDDDEDFVRRCVEHIEAHGGEYDPRNKYLMFDNVRDVELFAEAEARVKASKGSV